MFSSTNSLIIADRIVTKTSFGVSITPVSRLTKKNISITHIPTKSFGTKIMDNTILGLVSDGVLDFSQL